MNSVNERLESVKNDMLEVKSLLDATKYMEENKLRNILKDAARHCLVCHWRSTELRVK